MEDDGFRDRNQRYGYLVARENARRLLADPSVLEGARRHLERFCAGIPQRRRSYELWSALLEEGAAAVAARLTERGARGDDARETAPSFGGLSGPVRARLLAEARAPLDEAVSPGTVA
jgi:hypothetical protein